MKREKLLQFDFDDLTRGGAYVGQIVSDFCVDIAKIAGSDFVRGGLAIG